MDKFDFEFAVRQAKENDIYIDCGLTPIVSGYYYREAVKLIKRHGTPHGVTAINDSRRIIRCGEHDIYFSYESAIPEGIEAIPIYILTEGV